MRRQTGAIAAEQLATVRALPRPLELATDSNRGSVVRVRSSDIGQIVPLVNVPNPCTGPAEPIQIVLASELVEGCAPPNVLPQIRALLTWGVGQTSVQAEVDVLLGTSIALSVEVLKIDVFYHVVALCDGSDVDLDKLPTFDVWALLGYGTISRPQLTEVVPLFNADETVTVAIPPFAREVHVMSSDGGALDVSLVGAAGCFRTGCRVCGCGDRFPIWNGASCVEITNRSGRSPTTAVLVFHLGL